MRLELELQYAEFHPDQVEKVGPTDLDQALRVIHSYPWEREFSKIEERSKEDLTSTIPSVAIKNKHKEIIIISARDKENFIVEFLSPTHHAELILPNSIQGNSQGITVEIVVVKFYEGTLTKILPLKPIAKAETSDARVYRLKESSIFLFVLISVILILVLVIDFLSNGFSSKAFPAVFFVGLVILMNGSSALVILQYIFNDWGKVVEFEQDGLTIKQKGKMINIRRSEIAQVAVVENESHRTLSKYKYARIKTKDGKAFIVTSFIMEPMDLVNKLKINHKAESVFLPIIRLDIQSEKEKQRIIRDRHHKKMEFLEIFKDYDDSKLWEIIRDSHTYADYAIEAANEILERRQITRAAQKVHKG